MEFGLASGLCGNISPFHQINEVKRDNQYTMLVSINSTFFYLSKNILCSVSNVFQW